MNARYLPIRCRFAEHGCLDEAVAYVEFEDGCACFPEDRRQYLCLQHLSESEPISSGKVLCPV